MRDFNKIKGETCPARQGRKLLSLGIRSLPCHALGSPHNQQFMEGEKKKSPFWLPHGLGRPSVVPLPPHCGAEAPKLGCSTHHHSAELPWRGQQAEVGCQSTSVQGPSLCLPQQPQSNLQKKQILAKR